MIYGVGTDLVEVARIQESLERFGLNFAMRVLSEAEMQEFKQSNTQARFLAKRFAAKEAFVKALGTGFMAPAMPKNISVAHDKRGRPILEFNKELRSFMDYKRIDSEHISISDEKNIAAAFVVLSCKP